MFASVAPRLAALIAHHGVAIAAGALSGAVVAGAGVATGIIPTGGASGGPRLAMLACPGSGSELGHISPGEPMLVTGRSTDGTWLQVYIPRPGVDRGWVPSSALRLQAAPDSLPIAGCIETPGTLPPPATAGPSGSPTPSASPTPAPTGAPTAAALKTPKPTSTPKPTGTPFIDTTAPVITNLVNDGGGELGYWEVYAPSATCDPHFVTISATVTDPDDPIKSVTLYYTTYGAAEEISVPMVKVSSTTWQYVLNALDSWNPGQITYHVTAADSHGNSTDQMYDQENYNLYLQPC